MNRGFTISYIPEGQCHGHGQGQGQGLGHGHSHGPLH